jgi:Na+/melibiose symporter-like transporter
LTAENVLHVVILLIVLLASAGAAIVVLGPLLFDAHRDELARARPWVLGAALLAIVLIAVEWLGAHGGWS